MKENGIMTSNHNEWSTPMSLFNKLNDEFHFTLDFCATKENAKCAKFYTIEINALKQNPKGEVIFCNPPYTRIIQDFVRKLHALSKDNTIVLLLPCRTDTSYWHDCIINSDVEVRFIRGRVQFEGKNGKGEFIKGKPCTFPCAIVIFRPSSVCF
jgi:site-specific DNA-methyltransferase (adenine-specific)